MDEKKLKLYKSLHLLSLLIGLLTIVLPIVFWGKIPDQIPLHYNAAGVVDNWSDKSSMILLFFVVAMMMGIMSICVFFVKSNIDSKYTDNSQKTEMQIVYPMLILMNLVIQIMFAYIVFCCATCRPLGVWFLPLFAVATAIPIIVMIYKCGKVQSPSKSERKRYKKIEREEKGKVYRSRVDIWMALILLGSELLVLFIAIEPIVKRGEIEWISMGTMILTSVLILPLFAMKYVMYSEHLLISMSIYGKARVRYADIKKMAKTMNPLSSAAMSLRRLQIDYVEDGMHRTILISPKNRDAFMNEINRKKQEVTANSIEGTF